MWYNLLLALAGSFLRLGESLALAWESVDTYDFNFLSVFSMRRHIFKTNKVNTICNKETKGDTYLNQSEKSFITITRFGRFPVLSVVNTLQV